MTGSPEDNQRTTLLQRTQVRICMLPCLIGISARLVSRYWGNFLLYVSQMVAAVFAFSINTTMIICCLFYDLKGSKAKRICNDSCQPASMIRSERATTTKPHRSTPYTGSTAGLFQWKRFASFETSLHAPSQPQQGVCTQQPLGRRRAQHAASAPHSMVKRRSIQKRRNWPCLLYTSPSPRD